MTNALGTGTVNLPVNIPVDERLALGKAALKSGARSVGDYVRKLILLGLEADNKLTAREVREIRRKYYGVAHTVCGIVLVVFTLVCGGELRKTSRRVEAEEMIEEAAL